ncbi:hypothetical protein MHZ93_19805 [Roseomonas sp. ACRSG]|nr:hypothetical protein [Roseomonas sp. ACRSG]
MSKENFVAFILAFSLVALVPNKATTEETAVDMTLKETRFSSSNNDPPCGEDVNGAILPPGRARCGRPCLDMPPVPIKETRLSMVDGETEYICPNGGNCGPGWAKFWSSPEVFPAGDHQRVCANVKNWSENRTRRFIMRVIY